MTLASLKTLIFSAAEIFLIILLIAYHPLASLIVYLVLAVLIFTYVVQLRKEFSTLEIVTKPWDLLKYSTVFELAILAIFWPVWYLKLFVNIFIP